MNVTFITAFTTALNLLSKWSTVNRLTPHYTHHLAGIFSSRLSQRPQNSAFSREKPFQKRKCLVSKAIRRWKSEEHSFTRLRCSRDLLAVIKRLMFSCAVYKFISNPFLWSHKFYSRQTVHRQIFTLQKTTSTTEAFIVNVSAEKNTRWQRSWRVQSVAAFFTINKSNFKLNDENWKIKWENKS